MLPLAGMATASKAVPGIPFARGLQIAAGMGFLLYCMIAFGLIAARLWLRRSSVRPAISPSHCPAAGRPSGAGS
jgi:hypothetical protein